LRSGDRGLLKMVRLLGPGRYGKREGILYHEYNLYNVVLYSYKLRSGRMSTVWNKLCPQIVSL